MIDKLLGSLESKHVGDSGFELMIEGIVEKRFLFRVTSWIYDSVGGLRKMVLEEGK
jgi:hypothetical protein